MKLLEIKKNPLSARISKLERQFFERNGNRRKGNALRLDLPPFNVKLSWADLSGIKIIDSYKVGPSTICITENYEYLVSDPPLTLEDKEKLTEIVCKLLFLVPERMLRDEQKFDAFLDKCCFGDDKLKYFLRREIFGYGVLEPVVTDPLIEDVVVSSAERPVACIHSSYGTMPTNITFSKEELNRFVERRLRGSSVPVYTIRPQIGIKFHQSNMSSALYMNEISTEGPNLILRKLPEKPWSITSLLLLKTICPEMAAWLMLLEEHRKSFLVNGAMGAGKTSLVNALCNFLPERSIIVTVEQISELKLTHPNHFSMVSRRHSVLDVDCRVGVRDLLEKALHAPADYVVVGDLVGEEGRVWAQALRTGYAGIACLHVDDPYRAIETISSPPFSADKSSLKSVSGIVSVCKFTSRLKGKPLIRRRVINFYDLEPDLDLVPLFNHDDESDSFSYRDDTLLGSNSAKAIMHSSGLTESALLDKYLKRVDFLRKLSNVSKYRPILTENTVATKAVWLFQSSPEDFNAEEFAFSEDEAFQNGNSKEQKPPMSELVKVPPIRLINDDVPGWMRREAKGREIS